MRTSIRDVAKHAGVSAMTVSSVLRGRSGEAGAETHRRVLRAVRELNYVPVRAARQNRPVQTHVLGIVFDYVEAATDYWGMALFQGLRQGALQHGYDLLVMLRPQPHWAAGRDEAQFLERRTDGFIFVAPYGRDSMLTKLVDARVPVLSVYETQVPAGVAYAVGDNVAATRTATQYLVERGHRRIGYIAGDLDKSYFRDRQRGYCEAMFAAGLAPTIAGCTEEGARITRAQVAPLLRGDLTAVVGGNDVYTLDFWKFAREVGMEVPDDLSLVGIDGLPEAAEAGLTTLRLDNGELGRMAIEATVALIQGAECESCRRIAPGHLIERTSVRTAEAIQ